MPILDSCSKCVDLKTAALITGGVTLGIGVFYFILPYVDDLGFLYSYGDDSHGSVGASLLLLQGFLILVAGSLLIVAAVLGKKWFIVPWLAVSLLVALFVFLSVIFTSMDSFSDERDDVAHGIVALILGLGFLALIIYAWLLTYSFFQGF